MKKIVDRALENAIEKLITAFLNRQFKIKLEFDLSITDIAIEKIEKENTEPEDDDITDDENDT